MPKYEVTFRASGAGGAGGKHVETFTADSATDARAQASRFRRSHGSSGASWRTASIKKVGD